MTITVSINAPAPAIHIDPKPFTQPDTVEQLEAMLQSPECIALITAYANVARCMVSGDRQ